MAAFDIAKKNGNLNLLKDRIQVLKNKIKTAIPLAGIETETGARIEDWWRLDQLHEMLEKITFD